MKKVVRSPWVVMFIPLLVISLIVCLNSPASKPATLSIPNVEGHETAVDGTIHGKGFPQMWVKTSETAALDGARIDADGWTVLGSARWVDASLAVGAAVVLTGAFVVVRHVSALAVATQPAATLGRKPAARTSTPRKTAARKK